MFSKREDFTNEQIAETYRKKGCNVSAACTALNINRTTFYRWQNDDEELKQMLEDADESVIDLTESKLLEEIMGGNITAIIFYLKTKGKKRGYIERTDHEVEVKTGEKMTREEIIEQLRRYERLEEL